MGLKKLAIFRSSHFCIIGPIDVLKSTSAMLMYNNILTGLEEVYFLSICVTCIACQRGGVSNEPPGSDKTRGQGSYGPSTG